MKGKPTPTRREQRARNRARARHAQKHDPNVRALYEMFSPPSRVKARAS